MNAKAVIFGAIFCGLASTAFTFNDINPGTKDYRWIAVDGPYACPSKEDVLLIVKHHTDQTELQMTDGLRAYYLVSGTIVRLVEEDSASGMSKIHIAGITSDLWTLTRFLSKHALMDAYGVIETPENSGLISAQQPSVSNTGERTDAKPAPGLSP
jgi:hypothetical protein